MKSGIHPKYIKATVHCACGNSWETMSTQENLRTDLCSNCHPFYTGEQRIVDTAGQVERFMRRMNARNEQLARAAVPVKRGSRNRANIAPPPQERRPAREQAEEEGGDVAVAVADEQAGAEV